MIWYYDILMMIILFAGILYEYKQTQNDEKDEICHKPVDCGSI